MNNSHPSTPAIDSALRDGSTEMFAVHFHMPDSDVNRVLLHADDPFLLMQIADGFQVLLTEGIGEQVASVGVLGSLVEGLILFNAPHRAKAIELALKFFKHHLEWMEIARYHAAELQWITVHPAGCTLPFDRWLTDEMHDARTRQTEPLVELLKHRRPGPADDTGAAPQT